MAPSSITAVGLSLAVGGTALFFAASAQVLAAPLTNPCATRPAATQSARTLGAAAPGAAAAGDAGHVALLAYTQTWQHGPSGRHKGKSVTSGGTLSSAASSGTASTGGTSKQASPDPSNTVSPGGTNSPAATNQPTPASSAPTPTPQPTDTASKMPTGPPTNSPSPSPTSPSPSPSQPPGALCLTIQSLDTSGTVLPGGTAHFAIWVWVTTGQAVPATVSLASRPSGFSPVFSVCPTTGKATCAVQLNSGQAYELQAQVPVSTKTGDVALKLTASAAGTGPGAPTPASVEIKTQVEPPAPTPTPTPTPSTSTPGVGDGGALPPGTFGNAGVGVPGTVPALPNALGNPGSAFPQLFPSATPSPKALSSPVRVTDVSASLPLNLRLIGGQLLGLALLAAGLTLAVARLSLRRRRPAKQGEAEAATEAEAPAPETS